MALYSSLSVRASMLSLLIGSSITGCGIEHARSTHKFDLLVVNNAISEISVSMSVSNGITDEDDCSHESKTFSVLPGTSAAENLSTNCSLTAGPDRDITITLAGNNKSFKGHVGENIITCNDQECTVTK